MDLTTTIVAFFDSNPILKLIALTIAAVVLVFGFIWLVRLLVDLKKIVSHEHGNPQVHYLLLSQIKEDTRKLLEILEGHIPLCVDNFREIAIITGKEPYQRCPVESCQLFYKISTALGQLKGKFELYEADAQESRNQTAVSLVAMSSELQRLSGELILSLREGTHRDNR